MPEIEALRRLTKALAMLDAIICPEWEYRYYSYNSKWNKNMEMASMRNGCGDDWFLLFDNNGAALKGFAHEYPVARDASFAGLIQQVVPPAFASFLNEPAFTMSRASFCIWRRHTDPRWNIVTPMNGSVSPEQDGSGELMGIFDGEPDSYRDWAADYYEQEIPLAAVQAIYQHQLLNEQLIASLNPDISFPSIDQDMIDIGYPHKLNT